MSTAHTVLRAGPWQATLGDDGALTHVRVHGEEVLLRLMIVVRDDAWGTVPASVEILALEQDESGFAVELRGSAVGGDVHFEFHARLDGAPEGIEFAFDGVALQRFASNRIGFVALHPLRWSGHPVTVVHPDGSSSASSYPRRVAPHQPFLDVAGFRQSVSAGVVSIDFQGDVFETEDQRNWSDASFKTYSRPLSLPFPVQWQPGDQAHQKVRVTIEPDAGNGAVSHASPESTAFARSAVMAGMAGKAGASGEHSVSIRIAESRALPRIGLAVGPDDDLEALATVIADLAPDHLRIDVVVDEQVRGAEALRTALAQAVPVALAVHVGARPERALRLLRDSLVGHRAQLAAVMVFDLDAASTTDHAVGAIRIGLGEAIAGVPLIVGTDDNLAELNRNPVSIDRLQAAAVTFSLNPGVHDVRSGSVLETPDALGAMVATARGLAGGPVWLSPLTLRPRRNLYRQGATIDRVGRDDAASDERQHTPFAAAWLIATLAAAVDAEVAAVSLFEISGARGIVIAPDAAATALARVIAELTRAREAIVCQIGRPAEVAALALLDGTNPIPTLLAANRTDAPVEIELQPSGERLSLGPFDIVIHRPPVAAAAPGSSHA